MSTVGRKVEFTADDARSLVGHVCEKEESFSMAWGVGYQTMVKAIVPTIELEASDDDYSGDTYMLVRDAGGAPGFLTFGWGSCSGCDSLQACSSFAELAALLSSLASSIVWFDDDAAMVKWMREHDWKGDWSWHRESMQKFLDQAADKYGFTRPERGEVQ